MGVRPPVCLQAALEGRVLPWGCTSFQMVLERKAAKRLNGDFLLGIWKYEQDDNNKGAQELIVQDFS